MLSTIKLDKSKINDSEKEATNMIPASGAYIGEFKKAYSTDSPDAGSKADFLNLEFQTENGYTAYISLTTHNRDGSDNFNLAKVHQIMTVLKMATLNGTRDYVTNRWGATVEAMVFPELCGKRLGLLLQREEQTSSNGNNYWQISIVTVFDPLTRQTAKELLNVSPAKKLDEAVAYTKDKPLPPSKDDYQTAYGKKEQVAPSFDEPNDDVPF